METTSYTYLQNNLHKYEHLFDKALSVFVEKSILKEKERAELKELLYTAISKKITITTKGQEEQQLYCSESAYLSVLIGEAIGNVLDIYLLEKQHPYLVIKQEKLIWSLIQQAIAKGNVAVADKEEMFQIVVTKLLEKQNKGQLNSFRGEALFSTFIYIVTQRILSTAIVQLNKKKQILLSQNDLTANLDKDINNAYQTAFDRTEQHLYFLKTALLAFKKKDKNRFEFCLKSVYRLIFIELDIQILKRNYPNTASDLLLDILLIFGKNYHQLSKGELYPIINDFILQLENNVRATSADNLRKWFEAKRHLVWAAILGKNILQHQKSQHLPVEVQNKVLTSYLKKRKKWIDEYFEWLVYRFYGRIEA